MDLIHVLTCIRTCCNYTKGKIKVEYKTSLFEIEYIKYKSAEII